MRPHQAVRRFPPSAPSGPEPAPDLAALRDEAGAVPGWLPTGERAWLITRYRENRRVLADPAFSRAGAARSPAGSGGPGPARLRRVPLDRYSITAMDPPEHTRIRRLVVGAFSGRAAARLSRRVAQIAEGLAGGLAAHPPADLVTDFARPLSYRVICELLGRPEFDHPTFPEDVAAHLEGTDARAATRLHRHVSRLVAADRPASSGGLLRRLVVAKARGRLTEEELVALIVTIMVAGYETVAGLISGSVQVLLEHPEQLAAVRARRLALDAAVEELLRFVPISVTGGTPRVAIRPVSLDGARIAEGELVLPAIVSANRDPRVFPDPGRFDVARTPNPHLAFGFGPHRCLGAHLARVELRVALSVLLGRLPGMRLADPTGEVPWRTAGMLRGPERLLIDW